MASKQSANHLLRMPSCVFMLNLPSSELSPQSLTELLTSSSGTQLRPFAHAYSVELSQLRCAPVASAVMQHAIDQTVTKITLSLKHEQYKLRLLVRKKFVGYAPDLLTPFSDVPSRSSLRPQEQGNFFA